VLAAAIDRGITASGSLRDDRVISLSSDLSSQRAEVSAAEVHPQKEQRWANYPLGVVQQLQRLGHSIAGFDAKISGDVPTGAGLSSSAALEVATAGLLMKLNDLEIEPLEVAKLCQRAENEFVGVRSGLLDQATSVFGRADHVVYLDFRSIEVHTIPFPPGLALVIVESGVKHSLLQSQYNARREETAAAAERLGASALRDVTPATLEEARDSLDPLLYHRAAHIVGENDRVWQAVAAMEAGNAHSIGALMNASHESSRVNFENSTPELDLLVSIAQSTSGVLGSRLTGGGFGGGTVTLVPAEDASRIAHKISSEYSLRSSHAAAAFVCRISDGAAVYWERERRGMPHA